MKQTLCPCGSGQTVQACCGTLIAGRKRAPTAEALMRSRYTAYVLEDVDYLVETTSPSARTPNLAAAIRDWMKQVEWQKLHLIAMQAGTKSDQEGTVEFIAEYLGPAGVERHHEISLFRKERGTWFYVDGAAPDPTA